MASLLSRPLFSTKFMKGLSHNDVLAAVEKSIERTDIKSIQIKEKECVVTVSCEEAKTKLILGSTIINNRHITVHDVDNIITDVTVKDAPYEMADNVLTEHMSQYGEIIAGSVVRVKIKETNIENGTRYMKILNCVPILPLKDDIDFVAELEGLVTKIERKDFELWKSRFVLV